MKAIKGRAAAKVAAIVFGIFTMMLSARGLAQHSLSDRHDRLFRPWTAPLPRNVLPGQLSSPNVVRQRPAPREYSYSPILDMEAASSTIPERFKRQRVKYSTSEPAGTIIVDTGHTYLYLVLGAGEAIRYGIGVGRDGFTWSGRERITRMAEWPEWRPPQEMLEREPDLPDFVPGGLNNPLGARALYLGNTLYRIHGTNQPSTIGQFMSSGCIRLRNTDVIDLYDRVSVGTQVVVLPGPPAQSSSRR